MLAHIPRWVIDNQSKSNRIQEIGNRRINQNCDETQSAKYSTCTTYELHDLNNHCTLRNYFSIYT
jgi:hypothetical protein